ncbi:ABC transporter permease [Microbacterium sp. CJ88]|uniref:ABC transporter permease n=1 Tax=Microbacterium sp. CJ88 TaxID=3445672 RepID=UPI003F65DE2A
MDTTLLAPPPGAAAPAGPSVGDPAAPAPSLLVRARAGADRHGGGVARTVFWLLVVGILVTPILVFLLVAFSPAMFGQGTEWFTLSSFTTALSGTFLVALQNTVIVGVVAAVVSAGVGFGLAWLVERTDAPGRRAWRACLFVLLLAPSYLIALGWQRLFEVGGILDLLHIPIEPGRSLLYGPVGIIGILTVKGVPFAYLVIANALRGLGDEYEHAVRVHGGTRRDAVRIVVTLLTPAVWSAVAIVFAEAISDYGVASTLSAASHFPLATFALYDAVQNFPVQFPVASAISWILLALVVAALFAQSAALRGRSFRTFGGRTRPALRRRLSPWSKVGGGLAILVALVVMVGIPAFGAASASLMTGLGNALSPHTWSIDNYTRVLGSPQLRDPLAFSFGQGLIVASIATVLAVACARMLSQARAGAATRVLDFVLLAAVALPGIVFAAGYIFTYNLPIMNTLGIHFYGTSTLLTLAYVATTLPTGSRSLVGSMSQLQQSMAEASRAHGGGGLRTWLTVVVPVIARPVLSAWQLLFVATLLELPISQLLYPPGSPPLAVGIEKALSNYDFGGGTAMQVIAIAIALAVVGATSLLYTLLAPRGWKQIGRTS